MKKRIAWLAAVPAVLAAPALAQSAPQSAEVTVTGSVDRLCVLSGPQVNLGGAVNVGQVSGNTVTIADLSDDQQMTTKAADFTVSFPGMCNFTHQITISSDRGGLWRAPAGARPPGFANGVPYRATVDWAGSEMVLHAAASSEGQIQEQLEVDEPSWGDVEMRIHIDQGASNAGTGAPLEAGSYEDTIRITLGPL